MQSALSLSEQPRPWSSVSEEEMMDVDEDDLAILDDDEERELQELERYINGGVPGILPAAREIQMRPQSEIFHHRAPSTSSTLGTLLK